MFEIGKLALKQPSLAIFTMMWSYVKIAFNMKCVEVDKSSIRHRTQHHCSHVESCECSLDKTK